MEKIDRGVSFIEPDDRAAKRQLMADRAAARISNSGKKKWKKDNTPPSQSPIVSIAPDGNAKDVDMQRALRLSVQAKAEMDSNEAEEANAAIAKANALELEDDDMNIIFLKIIGVIS